MDSLSALLGAQRGEGAFVLRCAMTAPWSVEIADQAAVGVVVMLTGECLLQTVEREPVRLRGGDIAVVKGPRPYVLGDRSETPVGVVVGPGQVCRPPAGATAAVEMTMALGSWGNAPDGECTFLAAAYELPSQVRGRLLPSVPDLVVVPGDDRRDGLAVLLQHELDQTRPGQAAMLDRLVDLLLISTLRDWFSRPDAQAPRWWTAQADPLVGAVLTLMHDHPAHGWTLQALAEQTGYSRATVSRRFTELVGQPPMTYLAEWRLTLAADLLRAGEDSVEQIARAVGYANPFAFSSAFKRAFGRSPRLYRQAA